MADRFPYDRSSKWLIQHHGDSLLRLAGITDIESWRALPPESVQPRKLPDGLIEVRRVGRAESDLVVIEICSYPDKRVPPQLFEDAAHVYLDRGRWPEVAVIVLRPKGNVVLADRIELTSASGRATLRATWPVVELWNVSAESLLAVGDVGLVPWATLAHIDGPPEPVFERCREMIDRDAKPEEHENLLTVAAVFANMRYNLQQAIALIRRKEAMLDSPILREIVSERSHRLILRLLKDRFGTVPDDVRVGLQAIQDDEQLDTLNSAAGRCTDLDAFRRELATVPLTPPQDD